VGSIANIVDDPQERGKGFGGDNGWKDYWVGKVESRYSDAGWIEDSVALLPPLGVSVEEVFMEREDNATSLDIKGSSRDVKVVWNVSGKVNTVIVVERNGLNDGVNSPVHIGGQTECHK
jgi:hypothetical protein